MMKLRANRRCVVAVLLAWGAVACGNLEPGTGNGGSGGMPPVDAGSSGSGNSAGEGEPYLPWAEGNQWTYLVTADGDTFTKVTTVEAEETVGGSGPHSEDQANRVRTEKGADLTLSWQVATEIGVVRYREQSFSAATGDLALEEHWDPHKIHFDETPAHTEDGATWLEEYEETKLPVGAAPVTSTGQDRWTVIAVDEEVTVPAGTFSAIVVEKTNPTSTKTYYYVRGVGKVKEVGTQVEELASYEVGP